MPPRRRHIAAAILIPVIAIVIAGICRTFCVEFYRVAPAQMENTLLAGDRICVLKWTYGIRLPQTFAIPGIDTIPLTHIPARLPASPLPYARLFTSLAQRNDIVVYNYPLPGDSPISHCPTAIARCMGIPGDTVEYSDGQLRINGKEMAQSPLVTDAYRAANSLMPVIRQAMHTELHREAECDSVASVSILYLDRYSYDRLAAVLPDSALLPISLRQDNYTIELPPCNMPATITPSNAAFFAHIINRHEPAKVTLRGDCLYRGGRRVKAYQFSQPYYWLVGDNRTTTIDSRHFGAIPHSHLVGRCHSIIYSLAPHKDGNGTWRGNRFMQRIVP